MRGGVAAEATIDDAFRLRFRERAGVDATTADAFRLRFPDDMDNNSDLPSNE